MEDWEDTASSNPSYQPSHGDAPSSNPSQMPPPSSQLSRSSHSNIPSHRSHLSQELHRLRNLVSHLTDQINTLEASQHPHPSQPPLRSVVILPTGTHHVVRPEGATGGSPMLPPSAPLEMGTSSSLIYKAAISPFISSISEEALPKSFKMPHINRYDGSGDPTTHIMDFDIALMLYSISDVIKCRAFLQTLTGPAQA